MLRKTFRPFKGRILTRLEAALKLHTRTRGSIISTISTTRPHTNAQFKAGGKVMGKVHRICISLSPVLVFICAISISAQWNKKPYTELSEKEARKLLNDSPWGQTRVYSYPSNAISDFSPARPPGASSSESSSQFLNIRIRFLSARPIRQAFSQLILLKQKGGQALDPVSAQLNAFVTRDFPNDIVVSVDCDATALKNEYWSFKTMLDTKSLADLKLKTYLSAKGQRTFIESYQPPERDGFGARFIFPRTVNGNPSIPPDSDDIQFYSEFSEKYKLNMRFKTKDMMFDGKLEY